MAAVYTIIYTKSDAYSIMESMHSGIPYAVAAAVREFGPEV
jgi:hypothetical protein